MKITHNKVGQNLNVRDSGKSDKTDKASDAAKGGKAGALDLSDLGKSDATKVDLSPRAQEMKKIKDAALAAPDINEEKVSRLQKLIDEGKYSIDAKDIADKMVDEQILWS